MKEFQEKLLNEAKEYVLEKNIDDFELLTEIQHFGGATRLIDFTEDYLIALFFACDKSPEKHGRVIFPYQKDRQIMKSKGLLKQLIALHSRRVYSLKHPRVLFVISKQGSYHPSQP